MILSPKTLQSFPLYCLFKGEWGTRKSTSALSFPQPQYWFDFDQKMEGLILPMKNWGIDQVEYDSYNDWAKAEVKLKSLQAKCPYKTIVIDTISSCADSINRQTLKLKEGTTTNQGQDAGRKIAGIAVNTEEDYKAETSALQNLMALTKDIHKYHKVNVVLVAHVISRYQKEGSKTHIARTIVTGAQQMAAKIPGYCHEIYHFNMKGDMSGAKYSVLTTHTRDDFARTSLPLAKEIVFEDDPLYEKYLVPAMVELLKTK